VAVSHRGRVATQGRERQRPFSLENVTGQFTLISGRPRCRRAPQKRQNRQKLLWQWFLVFLSFLRCVAGVDQEPRRWGSAAAAGVLRWLRVDPAEVAVLFEQP
jgi:hypothetical protein